MSSQESSLVRLASIVFLRCFWFMSIHGNHAAHSFPGLSTRRFGASVRSHSFQQTVLWSSTKKAQFQGDTVTSDPTAAAPNADKFLIPLLHEYAYDRRLLTISNSQLPLLAEVFHQGQCKLCRLISFHHAASKDPRIKIEFLSFDQNKEVPAMEMVDVGQITTVWQVSESYVQNIAWLKGWKEATRPHPFPSHARWEKSLNDMYHAHVGRARSSATGLAKKQLGERMLRIPEESRSHVESVLRHLRKAGNGLSRLIDSRAAVPYLYDRAVPQTDLALQRQAVAALALAKDAELGGRFKRMSCVLVAFTLPNETNANDGMDEVESISIINGGWLVLDQSVRAGAEARKLVERIENQPNGLAFSASSTAADERILHRLECLAMGEVLGWAAHEPNDVASSDKQLEVDVQETLKTLGFPATAEGAKSALLKIGRWTQDPGQIRLDPWSKDVIDAARWYANIDKQRRLDTRKAIEEQASQGLDGRVDLTKLPCVCIDAARTSFRDDAIGLRSRSSTGRPVVEGGSKWEVLIHITDVSDIFSPLPTKLYAGSTASPTQDIYLRLLREAAASRGASRYDLSLGPLHLMPPVVLEALSLETNKIERLDHDGLGHSGVNRCVTVWAYIHAGSGKLLDAGLERTLISSPVALSFAEASDLLVSDAVSISDPSTRQAGALLQVANKILSLWSKHHQQQNRAAEEREKRLAMKEVVAQEINRNIGRDDGRDGFQRSPGHRLVDVALDLYGHSIGILLRRAKAPIPRAAGSGDNRGGRVGTAPLRRYIDAIAQRQALSVLCRFGGPPLSRAECLEASKVATNARNKLAGVHSFKANSAQPMNRSQQRQALKLLQTQLVESDRPIQAVSTGRENEVAIVGIGAVAKCRGVDGSLAPGDRIMVRVQTLDPEKGLLYVTFLDFSYPDDE